jgi:hypothetical protein
MEVWISSVAQLVCYSDQEQLFLHYVHVYETQMKEVIPKTLLRYTVALYFASSIQGHTELQLRDLVSMLTGNSTQTEIIDAVSKGLQTMSLSFPVIKDTKNLKCICDHEDTRVFFVPDFDCVIKRHYTVSGPWKDEIDARGSDGFNEPQQVLPTSECINEVLTYQALVGQSPYLGQMMGLVVTPVCVDIYVAYVPSHCKLGLPALMDPTAITQCMHKLAQGLLVMHNLQIGHRDVKFENILIDAKGDPVLVDFGSTGYGRRRTLPACTLTTRSVHLLALEVKDSVSGYDPKAVDVWSFAVIYLELLLQVRLLHSSLYREDIPSLLDFYRVRIPFLLDRLDRENLGSSRLRTLLRQSLLSASPEDQPCIADFLKQ